jgi:SPX domain protein involved in polyphosphate accumulation
MVPDNKFLFVRKEKKYLIDIFLWKGLRTEIASHLFQEKYRPTGYVSWIESIYYDNPFWKTYIDHKTREMQRFKLRIRQYGKKPKCFIELKEKNYGISYKSRFKIKPQWLPGLLNTNTIPRKLRYYNKKLNQVQLTYILNKVKAVITEHELVPVIKIQYQRESFKNREGLRITFDRNLNFSAIHNSHTKPVCHSNSFPRNIVIMETKYSGSRPQWLKDIIKKYQISKKRFSKYCAAVECLYALNNPLCVRHEECREEEYAGIS